MKKHKRILPYNKTLPKYPGGGNPYSNPFAGVELKAMFQPLVDWWKSGGKEETKEEIKNIPNQVLDAGAMLDPTPVLDGLSGTLYTARGMYDDAALSYGSMFLPSFLGGILKGGGKGAIKGAKNIAKNTTEKLLKILKYLNGLKELFIMVNYLLNRKRDFR